MGALLDYAVLQTFSLVHRDNLILLIFFSLTFTVFMNELFVRYRFLDVEIKPIRLY